MIRIALIGAGAFAQVHLDVLTSLPQVEVVWVCDADADVARASATRFGVACSTNDHRRALDDPLVDAVDIVTPNHLHAAIAVEAAQAGKHVICEKPLARTVSEAQRMAMAAEASGVRLLAKYHQRFDPVHQELADLVATDPGAFRVGMARRVSDHLATLLDRAHWRGDPALTGGGLLFSSGSHTLDILLRVFGPVTAVTAVARQLVADDPGKADDNATVVLEHARGALTTFTGCWTARQDSNTVIDAISTDRTLRAATDGDDLVLLQLKQSGVVELRRSPDWFAASNRRALTAIVDALAEGTALPDGMADAIESMAVLEAAYCSSAEGRRVTTSASSSDTVA